MIEILLRHPRILHQTADHDGDMPNSSIAICADITPVIVMSQEGREIILNLESVDELAKALKDLRHELLIEEAEKEAEQEKVRVKKT